MTTLTYNPNEAPEGELTAEEQESLAIGEKALAEQEALLAGKFRDAEELEQAYIELPAHVTLMKKNLSSKKRLKK